MRNYSTDTIWFRATVLNTTNMWKGEKRRERRKGGKERICSYAWVDVCELKFLLVPALRARNAAHYAQVGTFRFREPARGPKARGIARGNKSTHAGVSDSSISSSKDRNLQNLKLHVNRSGNKCSFPTWPTPAAGGNHNHGQHTLTHSRTLTHAHFFAAASLLYRIGRKIFSTK